MKFRDANHSGTGDIIIQENNNTNIGKLYIQCTDEELFEEREFRQNQLKKESQRRKKEKEPCVIFSIIILLLAAIYGYYKDPNFSNFVNWIYTFPGAIFSLLSIRAYLTPNQYEQKHLKALNEIRDILRERGVE
ncbi:hypothetical protein B0187_06120 [Haemophilus paracuniculus]|uniref:Uncharacterized protein n=1 Tax=Haemophilus paracuniculus TaxID=734 RepID=A0A1T0ASB7_9PAST|nr:hypothetical protein [Haemophilus paracuniculus]OOR99329.1 hypothetical protein B0187_06120 [Haemophilus paracuniculus]